MAQKLMMKSHHLAFNHQVAASQEVGELSHNDLATTHANTTFYHQQQVYAKKPMTGTTSTSAYSSAGTSKLNA